MGFAFDPSKQPDDKNGGDATDRPKASIRDDVVDPFKGRHRELRGIPLIGAGMGALENTMPGGELGAVRRLEVEIRELRGSSTTLVRVRLVISRRGVERRRVRYDPLA